MKSVMISIHPKWCELIANGKKTVEVRKTKPKIETPFRCFIYETKGKIPVSKSLDKICGGIVIGEFVCDKILSIWSRYAGTDGDDCLSFDEREAYLGAKMGYGWHISDLQIYDKPKELSEFGLKRPPQSWCY